MYVDLFVPSFNRDEFAQEMARCLRANTDWSLVRNLYVASDGPSGDHSWRYVMGAADNADTATNMAILNPTPPRSGPVAMTNAFLDRALADPFAPPAFVKLDTDTLVPPGWLEDLVDLSIANPTVDLIGIEAMNPPAPCPAHRSLKSAAHIGGIGLMQYRAFCGRSRPIPNGRFGFTEWQQAFPDVKKAWINPSIPVVLLDHVPEEPWASLSRNYEARGWQRKTGSMYGPKDEELLGWWRNLK